MNNMELLESIFINTFDLKKDQLPGLEYNSIQAWDSIGHMTLMSEIEERFGIFLEVDDIISYSSFETGIEILKKYNVEF
jgi:acyl carrier protein